MIGLIAAKVVRQVLLEAKFLVSAVLVVLLFGIGSLIAVGRQQQILAAYERDLVHARAASSLDGLLLVKSPHPLGFVAGGGWWNLPRLLQTGPRGVEVVAPDEFKGSFLAGFEDLDWVYLIAVVLSLLAIFISYDAVAGEREEGTLRLILAHPVRRSSVLLGTAVGLLGPLLVPLLLGLLTSLVVIQLSPAYELAPRDFPGLLAVAVFAVLYLAFFVLLSVLVSSLCRHSSTALIWLILFWVVSVVVLPGNGAILAALIEPPPQHRDEVEQVRQIEGNTMASISDYFERVREIVDSGRDDRTIQENLDLLRDRLVREQVGQLATRDRLIAAIHEEFARRRLRQTKLSRLTTLASPAVFFRDGVERLLTSGDYDHLRFLEQAREYQRSLRGPLARERERRAAEADPGLSWTTGYGGFSITGVLERSYQNVRPAGSALPSFVDRRPSFGASLAAAAGGLLTLTALCCGLLIAALRTFSRYDVR
jgi:hypothetical protein